MLVVDGPWSSLVSVGVPSSSPRPTTDVAVVVDAVVNAASLAIVTFKVRRFTPSMTIRRLKWTAS
jgi:hypothetical protein